MSEIQIRRRSLPDSLRWLADQLDSDTLTEAERAGVALTLRMLADDIAQPPRQCTCGAPEGDDWPNALLRNDWQHASYCPFSS